MLMNNAYPVPDWRDAISMMRGSSRFYVNYEEEMTRSKLLRRQQRKLQQIERHRTLDTEIRKRRELEDLRDQELYAAEMRRIEEHFAEKQRLLQEEFEKLHEKETVLSLHMRHQHHPEMIEAKPVMDTTDSNLKCPTVEEAQATTEPIIYREAEIVTNTPDEDIDEKCQEQVEMDETACIQCTVEHEITVQPIVWQRCY